MIIIYLILALFLLLILRDIVFRLFFIYPLVDKNGDFARCIEHRDILKWTAKEIKSSKRLQVGFIGNSHVMDAIDPEIIKKETSMSAYNVALYYIPLPNILELLCQNNFFPQVIFIDFSTRYAVYDSKFDFYAKLLRAEYDLDREKRLDSLAFYLPSVFVPAKYRFLLKRTWAKLSEIRKVGHPSVGRYTPFKNLVGFSWKVKKSTNHRYVERYRSKSRTERFIEMTSLRSSINESSSRCSQTDENYLKSFVILEEYVKGARDNGSKIVFMRLPLDGRLVAHENRNLGFYFSDVMALAERYDIHYLDFNDESNASGLHPFAFYIDGQHVEHSSAVAISHYVSKLINNKL